LIVKNDALGLYVFMCSLSDSIQASLYNSFEKGQITKYKGLVNALNNSGFNQFTACLDALIDAEKANDQFAAIEILTELSDDCIKLLKERSSPEVADFINEASNKDKAA